MHQPLFKSYKGVFPFKIGTTSYIYPDHLIPKVRMLGPFLDEIEILLFESKQESLPTKRDIQTLARMKTEFGLTYNVHLPADVPLTDPEGFEHAAGRIRQVIELTRPLTPSTHTLHLHCDIVRTPENIENWRTAAAKGVEKILENGMPPESVSIESLDYPLAWVTTLIDRFGLGVCLDIGHLFRYGFDAKKTFDEHAKRTPILHVHGVENGKDHLSLDRLSEKHAGTLQDILRRFTGVVSIEVFSYDHLCDSLTFFEKLRPERTKK